MLEVMGFNTECHVVLYNPDCDL